LFALIFLLPEGHPAAYRFPLWVGALLLIPGIWAAASTTQERPKPRLRQAGTRSLLQFASRLTDRTCLAVDCRFHGACPHEFLVWP
jgi:hypothetical protein